MTSFLTKFNSSPLKFVNPKGKDRLPSIKFSGVNSLPNFRGANRHSSKVLLRLATDDSTSQLTWWFCWVGFSPPFLLRGYLSWGPQFSSIFLFGSIFCIKNLRSISFGSEDVDTLELKEFVQGCWLRRCVAKG